MVLSFGNLKLFLNSESWSNQKGPGIDIPDQLFLQKKKKVILQEVSILVCLGKTVK